MANTTRLRGMFELGPLGLTAIALVSCLLAGCSEDSSDTSPSGGSAGTAGSAGTGGSGGAAGTGGTAGSAGSGPTVAVHGTVSWYDPPDPPASTAWTFVAYTEGMEICQHGTQNCVKTDANGSYELAGLPANAQVALVMTHPDCDRYVLQLVTEASDRQYSPGMVHSDKIAKWLPAGCSSPPAAGTGVAFLSGPPGSHVVLTPAPPGAIIYTGADGMFDPSLTELPAGMPADLTGAVTCGLTPGSYQVDFEQTTGSCHMIEGWPGDGHDVKLQVEADSVTVTNWSCK
jgi:hypothetical protein